MVEKLYSPETADQLDQGIDRAIWALYLICESVKDLVHQHKPALFGHGSIRVGWSDGHQEFSYDWRLASAVW